MESYDVEVLVCDIFQVAKFLRVHRCCGIYSHFIFIPNNIPLYLPHAVYPFISWWTIGFFPSGATVNMLLWTLRFTRGHTSSFPWCLPTWRSCSRGTSVFNHLRDSQPASQTAAPFHILPRSTGWLQFLHLDTWFLSGPWYYFFRIIVSVGMKWCLLVVLMCMSLMLRAEHPFRYLWVIWVSSLRKCLLRSIAHC